MASFFAPHLEDVVFLPAGLIDRCVARADGPALKLLLILFRHRFNLPKEEAFRLAGLADAEGEDAIRFWVAEKVLSPIADGWCLSAEAFADKPPVREVRRPSYNMRDIEDAAQKDSTLRDLLQAAQQLYGRTFSRTETEILFSFYDYQHFPADVIYMLLNHCAELGKTSMRYTEKVAISWEEAGVRTAEDAERLLEQYARRRSAEGMIRRIFGLGERALSAKEENHIAVWTGDWGFGEDLIRLAYERCVDKTGKLNFTYINTILGTWHERGYRTEEDTLQDTAPARKNGKKDAKKAPSSLELGDFSAWEFDYQKKKES